VSNYDYCARRSIKDYGESRRLRCEFSQTDGVKLADLRAYYKYIKEQALMGISFSKDFPLAWEVVDHDEMFIYPNVARSGLQLSDVLASAFFSGLGSESNFFLIPARAGRIQAP
jgi:hypothetical protein